jgi:hypothetical protein
LHISTVSHRRRRSQDGVHVTLTEEARANLIEAITLFFETASPSEVARRFHNEVFVTQVEVPVG